MGWLTYVDGYCRQSFVVAVLAIVIATFSTGIDSKCFQVNYKLWFYLDFLTLCSQYISDRSLQFKKDNTPPAEDDVPYGYGFFHFVFATGAMYFAMLLIGWNTHHSMRKYGSPLLLLVVPFYLHLTGFSCFSLSKEKKWSANKGIKFQVDNRQIIVFISEYHRTQQMWFTLNFRGFLFAWRCHSGSDTLGVLIWIF